MRTKRQKRKRKSEVNEDQLPPRSINSGDEADGGEAPEEYVVERVIGERINEKSHKKYYRLKWQGYTSEDDTWEPEDNLDCPKLIEEFHKRIGSSTSCPKVATVNVKVRRFGSFIEYLEITEKTSVILEAESSPNTSYPTCEKCQVEKVNAEKINEPAQPLKHPDEISNTPIKSALLTAKNLSVADRNENKVVSAESDEFSSKAISAAPNHSAELSGNSSKGVGAVLGHSAELKASAASSPCLPEPTFSVKLSSPKPSFSDLGHISIQRSSSVLHDTTAPLHAHRSVDMNSCGSTKDHREASETSESEGEDEHRDSRRYPAPGRSFMERGAIPQYILTVIEPHENHPLSYVVKYKNRNKMECVPSEIISKMWPQVVIEFYEKWLTESVT